MDRRDERQLRPDRPDPLGYPAGRWDLLFRLRCHTASTVKLETEMTHLVIIIAVLAISVTILLWPVKVGR